MEPDQWSRRPRKGREAKALRPAEWMLEAAKLAPADVEAHQRRYAVADNSVNVE